MRLLAFSDLHRDLDQAAELVRAGEQADVVVGAGDFASVHEGLAETIEVLSAIEAPTLLVPGNNETEQALREAAAAWPAARVLHGEAAELAGVEFFGLGAGVPVTPWDWSFDLTEAEAGGRLQDSPAEGVLIVHSPPRGHVDRSSAGDHLGSTRDPRSNRGAPAATRRLRPHPRELGRRVPPRPDPDRQPRA